MAKCWQCSVPVGRMYQHCGNCEGCCKPAKFGSGGGGGGYSEKKGCPLFMLMVIAPVIVLLAIIFNL